MPCMIGRSRVQGRRIGETITVAHPKGTVPFSSRPRRAWCPNWDSPPLIPSPIRSRKRRRVDRCAASRAAIHAPPSSLFPPPFSPISCLLSPVSCLLPSVSLLLLLALTAGCSSLNLDKAHWPLKSEEKPGKPDKIVAMWTDTVLYQTGQPPTRGFGGRLMFYEGKKEKPVKAEGNLVIYAFDETGRGPAKSRPDRKYVFTADQIPLHYSKSQIGHSYSVWVPWDAIGGEQKEISLIVRFEPKEGAAVTGEQSRQLLPGRSPTQEVAGKTGGPKYPSGLSGAGVPPASAAGGAGVPPASGAGGGPGPGVVDQAVRPVSYEAPAPPSGDKMDAAAPPRRMTTTTIPIPSNLAAPGQVSPTAVAPPAAAWQGPSAPALPSPPTMQQQTTGTWNPPAPRPAMTAPAPAEPAGQNLPPRSRFGPGRSRPLGEPFARLNRDHGPWAQRPAGPPSVPASAPGWENAYGSPASPLNAAPPTY